jgi:Na+-driven multidrug efflux pump
MENMNEKDMVTAESEFSSKSITSLFWKYSLFALAGMSVQMASTVADGFFVGNGIGPVGMGAVGIIVPFWITAVAFFNLFGVGSSILAAIKLGNGDKAGARDVYGSVVVFSFFFSIVLAVIVLLNVDTVLIKLGATPEILPAAREYVTPYLIGVPLCVVGTVGYYFTRLAERPLAASIGYMAPAVIAIISEYIFIFRLHMGMAGSAIPWIICVGTSVLLLPYLQMVDPVFKLKISDFKVDFRLVLESCKIGFALFIVNIATIFSTIIINNLIAKYGDPSLYIPVFAIINAYIAYFLMLVTVSFIQGIQPIVSFNYGAKLYSRVRSLIKVGIVQSSVFIILVMLLIYIFATQIVTFFIGPVPPLVDATVATMKIFLLLYAFGNVSQIVTGYFMAVEKNGLAILNGTARIIIFAVPLLFILPNYFGLNGIWMAQPGADLLSFALALVCILNEYKNLKKQEKC